MTRSSRPNRPAPGWAHATGLFRAPRVDGEAAMRALGLPLGLDAVHHFEPHGVSWARVAEGRRAAIHSWPEHGLVTVDVYAPAPRGGGPLDLAAALAPLGWVALPEGRPAIWATTWAGGYRVRLALEKVLLQRRTAFQEIVVADTPAFGRVLLLDGELQSAESDEATYHEALVLPAMFAHPAPRRVLVVGAGEGASAREVLRAGAAEVVLVDIDPDVVEASRRYLPSWHRGAFDDPRVTLHIGDARSQLREPDLWDVVIVDVSDPSDDGPSRDLFGADWYAEVQASLAPGGVVVAQAGELFRPDGAEFRAVSDAFRSVFPAAVSYAVEVPSFGAHWGFVVSSPPVRPFTVGDGWAEGRFARACVLPGWVGGA